MKKILDKESVSEPPTGFYLFKPAIQPDSIATSIPDRFSFLIISVSPQSKSQPEF